VKELGIDDAEMSQVMAELHTNMDKEKDIQRDISNETRIVTEQVYINMHAILALNSRLR